MKLKIFLGKLLCAEDNYYYYSLLTICFTLARKKNMYIANKLINANKIV